MDILRKELNAIYEAQRLGESLLSADELERCRRMAESVALAGNGCTALTDASCDRCYLYAGAIGAMLGLADTYPLQLALDSSDEDIVYNRIHPEDLVDKRMLEYEYFRMVDPLPAEEKLRHRATCRFRIRDRRGEYVAADNSTQVIAASPEERIWLICLRPQEGRPIDVAGIFPDWTVLTELYTGTTAEVREGKVEFPAYGGGVAVIR